jgi:potassium-transporting ATPase KdpC subunit
MKTYILPAVRMLVVLSLVTGIAYPLAMTLFASVAFQDKANGSIVEHRGSAVGSTLIGQNFSSQKYFHTRPSAIAYNPLPSSGSNFGPTSKALKDSTAMYKKQFATDNNIQGGSTVPKEMISMSGSGLDPHISPEAGMLQVDRIARARGFSEQQHAALVALVNHLTEGPEFGFLGQARVNVLRLNLALEEMK